MKLILITLVAVVVVMTVGCGRSDWRDRNKPTTHIYEHFYHTIDAIEYANRDFPGKDVWPPCLMNRMWGHNTGDDFLFLPDMDTALAFRRACERLKSLSTEVYIIETENERKFLGTRHLGTKREAVYDKMKEIIKDLRDELAGE